MSVFSERRRVQGALYGARIDTKSLRYLADALSTPGRFQSGTDLRFQLRRYPRPSELLALCLGPPKTGPYPLLNNRALELGEDAKHLKHGLAARRCGVDALLVQEQVNASGMDF
jgi:hypothetical protein